MAAPSTPSRTTTFRVAWGLLVAVAALATLNHLVLSLILAGEATLFLGWAAYTAYATVVLAIPFRRGERWAWSATWILVAGFASLIVFDSAVGGWYAGAAGVMAVCLLLTRPAFFGPAAHR